MRITGGRSVQNLAIQTMSKVMMSIVINPVVAVGIIVGHIGAMARTMDLSDTQIGCMPKALGDNRTSAACGRESPDGY